MALQHTVSGRLGPDRRRTLAWRSALLAVLTAATVGAGAVLAGLQPGRIAPQLTPARVAQDLHDVLTLSAAAVAPAAERTADRATTAIADQPGSTEGEARAAADDLPGDVEVQVAAFGSIPGDVAVALTKTDQDLTTTLLGNLVPDAHGRVLVEGAWLRAQPREVSLCVDAGFPSDGVCTIQLAPDTRAVHMQLPELGRVQVVVEQADGTALDERATVEVRVLTAGPPADRRHRYAVVKGLAELVCAASALQIEVVATTLDGLATELQTVTGPSAVDETVRVVLRLAPRPTLSARLLDPAGRALASAPVEVRLANTSLRLSATPRTDRRGVVDIRQPGRPSAGPVLLHFDAVDSTGTALHGEVLADLATEGPLGDVWLAPSPLLVAGACVDEHGAPRAGVRVRLQQRFAPDHPRVRLFGDRWGDVAVAEVTTGADGAFVFLAPLHGELRVFLPELPGVVLPFVPGATEVRVVVPDGG